MINGIIMLPIHFKTFNQKVFVFMFTLKLIYFRFVIELKL